MADENVKPLKTELTEEEKALIPVIRDNWINMLSSPDHYLFDHLDEAEKGIDWLYSLVEIPPPMKIYVESPYAAQYAVAILKILQDITPRKLNIFAKDVTEVTKKDQIKQAAFERTCIGINDRLMAEVVDKMKDHELGKMEILAQYIHAKIAVQPKEYTSTSWYCNVSDYGWCAYYEFFVKSGIIETTENFDRMVATLKSGIYDTIQLHDVCIVSAHPEYIKRDAEGKLHEAEGYAIKWRDSYALTFWHGIHVPTKLVFFPEEITQEDLAKETNAEVRRCFQEKLGEEGFAKLLNTKVVESTTDRSGRPLLLVRTKEKDPVAEEYIQYIVLEDHSTERKYWICVPPNLKDARTALAWSYGKSSWEDYHPELES